MNCKCNEVPDNVAPHPTVFSHKCLSRMEWQYSNIKGEVLGILYGPEKFHHYCFAREVHIITDYKPLVAMISKDVVTLAQCLQCTMLNIHQYSVHILYKPGSKLFTVDFLSCHNHAEIQDQEIPGMNVSIHTISTSLDIYPYVYL